jgi:TatD DNase family protein
LAAIGVHPSTASFGTNYQLDKFEALIDRHKEQVKAIGEIGLDGKYSQDVEVKKRQKDVFRFFLDLASRRKLPVVVHSRQAVDEALEDLARFEFPKVLLHWYDGPVEKLNLIKDRGYLISISPAIFQSRRIVQIAEKASLEMILTETDAPVKYRGTYEGRVTQPSFVIDVIRRLAEIKTLDVSEVRAVVLRNFRELIQ